MGLSDQLTFYDLVGLIIPGGAIVAPVAWAVITLEWATWPALDPLTLGAAGLGAAYVLGHFSHLITRLPGLDAMIEGRGDGHPYEETLLDPDRVWSLEATITDKGQPNGARDSARLAPRGLSAVFYDRLVKALEQCLGYPPDLESRAGRKEAFGLCYAHVVQYGNPGRIQLFKGLSGFYRGMLTAAAVTVVVGLGTLAVLVTRSGAASLSELATWAALGLTLMGLLGTGLFLRGFHQMDKRFVLAVLRSFYVLSCANAMTPSRPQAVLEARQP